MEKKRLYFADWFRVIVVFSLIPFHAALSFTAHGDTYVYDPMVVDYVNGESSQPGIDSPALDAFTGLLSSFFMNLLFFISGIGTYYSLRKRSPGKYIIERAGKLMLPLAASLVLVIPLLSYYRNLSLFGYTGSFFSFYPKFFNGIRGTFPGANFEWAHLWFLVYLFVFSVISLPLFVRLCSGGIGDRLLKLSRTGLIFLPLLLIVPLECILRPIWPGFQNLYDDWANFSNYLIFFILGYLLVMMPGIMKKLEKAGIGLVIAGTAILALKMTVLDYIYNGLGIKWPVLRTAAIMMDSVTAYFMTTGLIGTGSRYFNKNTRLLEYLSPRSFLIYVFHFTPVTVLTYILIDTELGYPLRFILTTLFSIPAVILITEIVRTIPGLRVLFGIRGPDKPPKEHSIRIIRQPENTRNT